MENNSLQLKSITPCEHVLEYNICQIVVEKESVLRELLFL